MPGISQRRFHSTIREPSAEALESLAVHSVELMGLWHRDLLAIGLRPDDLLAGSTLGFAQAAEQLRQLPYPVFRRHIQSLGAKLAANGVRLPHALIALDRLYEICMERLNQDLSKRATPVLALARLHALVALLIVSGFTVQFTAGKKTIIEASLMEAEDRRRGTSAYVTRIYEQERRRLCQDLHDEVGHQLIVIKLYLEMIALGIKNGDADDVQARAAEALALVSQAIDSVRRIVLDLGPAVFNDLGFLPAVRYYISQFSSRTKIKAELSEGFVPDDIPLSHQVALYRVLQGGLSNVLKHASAQKVKVSLGSMRGSAIIMVIEDNGVGFDTTSARGRQSYGLTAMRERVEVLGGRFHVQSRRAGPAIKGHGTRIEIDLPLGSGRPQ